MADSEKSATNVMKLELYIEEAGTKVRIIFEL